MKLFIFILRYSPLCFNDLLFCFVFIGGRGIKLERWNETQRSFSDLAQVSGFTGLEDDYTIRHIDDLYLEEDTQDSVYRLKGFIKAPHDGEYVILVKGNKATRVYMSHGTADNKNPANKVCHSTESTFCFIPSPLTKVHLNTNNTILFYFSFLVLKVHRFFFAATMKPTYN